MRIEETAKKYRAGYIIRAVDMVIYLKTIFLRRHYPYQVKGFDQWSSQPSFDSTPDVYSAVVREYYIT